jgi:hypothetical protein
VPKILDLSEGRAHRLAKHREVGELRRHALPHTVHPPRSQRGVNVVEEIVAFRQIPKGTGLAHHVNRALVEVDARAGEDLARRADGKASLEVAVEVVQELCHRPRVSSAAWPYVGCDSFILDEPQRLVAQTHVSRNVAGVLPTMCVPPRVTSFLGRERELA